MKERKIEQLRESLAPFITMVRQLRINREEVNRIMNEMLDEGAKP
jgi:hypothetical protein